jgi:hypothetical protein
MRDQDPTQIDRQTVLHQRDAVQQARRRASNQLDETKEFLRPRSFVDRWLQSRNRIERKVLDKAGKVVKKNTPMIAIAAASALLFLGRKDIRAFIQRHRKNSK